MLPLLLCIALLVGSLLPWQPIVNIRLGMELQSPLWSGFISFLGGALLLGTLALLQGQVSERVHKITSTVPWWSLTGGVLGASFVIASILLVPRIGATTMSVAFVCGQLIMSVAMDHYGWGGLTIRPVDTARIIGIALLLSGMFLVLRPAHAP
jgi:bacterial/archaeal transporter family-2 protein